MPRLVLGRELQILALGSSDLVRGLGLATLREEWEEEAASDEERRQMNMQGVDVAKGDIAQVASNYIAAHYIIPYHCGKLGRARRYGRRLLRIDWEKSLSGPL